MSLRPCPVVSGFLAQNFDRDMRLFYIGIFLFISSVIYSLYIIYSVSHDRYYIGQTNSLSKRLLRHNNGHVRSTKGFRPWELVYQEEYETRAEAVRRETYLKSLKSKTTIKELVDTSRYYRDGFAAVSRSIGTPGTKALQRCKAFLFL